MGIEAKNWNDKKEPRKPQLSASELDHCYQPMGVFRWRANPKKDISFNEMLDPYFWGRVEGKMKVSQPKHQGQVIEVYPEDGSFFGEILAMRLPNGHMAFKKLRYQSLETGNVQVKREDFKIEFKGNRKNCIVRIADGVIIEDQFQTKHDAEIALEKHIASL